MLSLIQLKLALIASIELFSYSKNRFLKSPLDQSMHIIRIGISRTVIPLPFKILRECSLRHVKSVCTRRQTLTLPEARFSPPPPVLNNVSSVSLWVRSCILRFCPVVQSLEGLTKQTLCDSGRLIVTLSCCL